MSDSRSDHNLRFCVSTVSTAKADPLDTSLENLHEQPISSVLILRAAETSRAEIRAADPVGIMISWHADEMAVSKAFIHTSGTMLDS